MEEIALGFDIGGSKYNIGLVDGRGQILDQEIGYWSALTREAVLADLCACADLLLTRNAQRIPVVAGVTIPGLADPQGGLWVEASFSGIRDFPIASELSARYGIPAYVDNDGQACAMAEQLFGGCGDTENFLYVTVSNGVGGACCLDGKIYTGSKQGAGEIGHCIVVPGGRTCGCGNRGCLESYAAGPGLSISYLELGGESLADGTMPSAKEIAQRARRGERAALEAFRLEGEYLGQVIATAVNLLNPAKVVLGGGVSLAFDLFGPTLIEKVNRQIYRKANQSLIIEPTALGYNGGLYGAAAVAFRGLDHEKGVKL